jgi:methylthioribose-1-phosphate isomerase
MPPLESLPERARSLATKTYRPVFWHEDKLFLIDQRGLPTDFALTSWDSVESVAASIKLMIVRGAPAIGAAGAYGIVIAARKARSEGSGVPELRAACSEAKAELDAARPTAVNLMWATARMDEIAGALAAV